VFSPDAVSTIFDRLRPRLRETRRAVYSFRKSPIAMAGLVIIAVFLGMALFAPLIAPPVEGTQDPFEMPTNFAEEWFPPRDGHPFGQTGLGMDVFYGVVWGSRLSMQIGLEVVAISLAIGMVAGLAAGFYGRWIDELLMRITDVVFGIPSLILAMAVIVGLGVKLENLVISLVVVSWPTYARLSRSVALSVKNNLYVEAGRASGTPSWRIIIRHIFPNTISPVMVQSTLDIGSVVLVAAGLSFIGFSFTTPTTAEWGRMVQEGQRHFGAAPQDWWPVFYPGFFIFMFVLGFNMLGDGLRDVLDPRLRR
jgi:peptide/nickel transport system permease protein